MATWHDGGDEEELARLVEDIRRELATMEASFRELLLRHDRLYRRLAELVGEEEAQQVAEGENPVVN